MDVFVSEAQGPRQLDAFRDDILCETATDRANADHGRFERIDTAGHDPVQSKDHMRQDIEGIDCFIRMSAMSPDTFDLSVPAIHAARAGSGIDPDRPDWLQRIDMLGDDIVHAVHRSFRRHALRAAFSFFVRRFLTRLEEKSHPPGKFFL